MTSLLTPKLLLISLLAFTWCLPALEAHPDTPGQPATPDAVQNAASLAVPEPSSALLIGTVGVMLMLRRRRLHA